MALKLPGITVAVVNDAGIIAPPVYERYPVYIGEGDPYRLIENQRAIRSAGSVDNLVTPTTIDDITSVGDLPGISNYVEGTDYALYGTDKISWLPGGDRPTLGNAFYVTFTETRPASAYDPTLYFDENLIFANHGSKTRTNGAINDVSVAGSLGLNAGAKGVIIAQLNLSAAANPDSPTPTELENAFIAMRDELEKITDYKLVLVPLSSGTILTTSAASIFFNHAIVASQPENKQERDVFACLPKNTLYTAAAAYAQAYSNSRMIVPYVADGISWPVGFTTEYDTRFYVAAVAGKQTSVGIGLNISDEIIPGVLIKDNLTPGQFTYLVQNGVSPGKIRGEVVRNIMLITTDTTNALTEDYGVQDVKDYVKKYWREGLWDLFRNKPINEALVAQIRTASEGILDYLIGENIISQWRNVSAAQDSVEPRNIKVRGRVQPAYGMQWMDVVFTFVLSF